MGFTSGPVSFRRFEATGKLPSTLSDRVIKKLGERAFGRLPPAADDTQIGWIGPRHLFETEIDADQIAFGRFAFLHVRIDRLRAPANVLRSYVRVEEEALRASDGREYLSQGERRQARQAAADRAEKEARDGQFRRSNAYPVLIDLEQGLVLLGGLGAGAADALCALFHASFECPLEPVGPERAAYRLLSASGRARALENLTPAPLVPSPDGGGQSVGAWVAGDLSFLGGELLTWLWYRTETQEKALRLHGGDDVTVMLDRTLQLRCDFGLTGTTTIAADGPTHLPEARAALQAGKRPSRAGLIVGGALGEYRFTLAGPTLAVSGMQAPEEDGAAASRLGSAGAAARRNGPAEHALGTRGRGADDESDSRAGGPDGNDNWRARGDDDWRARLEQRFERIADAGVLIDALLELYLLERTGREWGRLHNQMSAWARGQRAAGGAATEPDGNGAGRKARAAERNAARAAASA